ncbi:MAG: histidine phosphatase family protein [Candidatus Eremiobacteraeota bacterium]|nr:histidine phosphatase family protein [Candidatus Eremiobacteraeota bacterium]MBV9647675.1 histidine phosphatase family protein [Candidatus Eremiobacteraeota bacterium]
MSTTLAIVRHGETTWNLEGRYQGRLESPLSPLGIEQARALAQYFATCGERGEPAPQQIFSSPLRRCRETADAVAQTLSLNVTVDARLIEIGHGTWQGRYRDEIAANDPERYWSWRNTPERVRFENGESLHDVEARWRSFAHDVVAHPVGALVVTHDALCRVALLQAMDRDLAEFWKVHVENGAFSRLAIKHDGLIALEECHSSHLAALRAPLERQAL